MKKAHYKFARLLQLPLLFSIPLLSYSLTSCNTSTDVVTTQFGDIRGSKINIEGAEIYSFKGIPYAKTPVGNLRFAPPINPDHWSGIKDCTKWGDACIQDDIGTGWDIQPQGEDCLNLNIWTPNLHPTTPLPVYIYIHGGVFTIGASEQSVFDGTAMSYNHGQKNVVVVTINYRLHALGFMALHALQTQALNDLDQPLWYQEDGSISTNQTSTPVYTNGNWGILDQIKALQWVHKNIANFGGDPANVTIGGESAGAFSVSALIVSPATNPNVQSDGKDLFQHAVLESGNLIGFDAISEETKGRLDNPNYPSDPSSLPGAIQICADFMNEVCMFSDSPAGVKALREVPTSWLAEWFKVNWNVVETPTGHTLNLLPSYDGWALPLDVDNWAGSTWTAIDSGNFRNVDIIWGYNTDEGYGFVPDSTQIDGVVFKEMVRNLLVDANGVPIPYDESDVNPHKGDIIPYKDALGYGESTNYIQAARDLLKYSAFASSSLEFVARIIEVKDTLELPKKNFYAYNFDYMYWYPSPYYQNVNGAAHTAELPFIFGTELENANAQDKEMSKIIMTYWTNFIATGNVNSDGLDEWPALSNLDIANHTQMHFEGGTLYNGKPYKSFGANVSTWDAGPKVNDAYGSLIRYIQAFYSFKSGIN